MPPTESVVATSSILICHYWSPYLFDRELVLEAQLTGLGLWKIEYGRILTIRIMTLTRTGSSTLTLDRYSMSRRSAIRNLGANRMKADL
jgi:hypothetical protein